MSSRIRSLRVEAVVLRHYDWGEADRILVLFTRELGKVRAIAKGIRKLRSRKAGHLEPFIRANLLLAKGRDLYIVTQAETVIAYDSLREDLVSLGYASYIVELLDRFTYEEGENRAMYRLLIDSLARLVAEDDPDLVVRYYEIRLLDLLGFRPHLFTCAVCEEEIKPQDQYFSARLGGVVCPTCGRKESGLRPISLRALKYLRHFQRSRFVEAKRARIAPDVNREMELLMQHYLTYLLERGLNSPVFLRRVRREDGWEADPEAAQDNQEAKS